MTIPSLLRLEEHRALSGITLSGRVLDLGGDKNSNYLRFFKGTFETFTVNMAPATKPDLVHDLEQKLPLADASYDHVLLINVLEHIFNYQQLLVESARVLKSGGTLVIVVPFLFPYHPSPGDYRRFSASALEKELSQVGLQSITVSPLGGGVFETAYLLIDRLLPKLLRAINFYTVRFVAVGLDRLLETVGRMARKKYQASDYALGFVAIGNKI